MMRDSVMAASEDDEAEQPGALDRFDPQQTFEACEDIGERIEDRGLRRMVAMLASRRARHPARRHEPEDVGELVLDDAHGRGHGLLEAEGRVDRLETGYHGRGIERRDDG